MAVNKSYLIYRGENRLFEIYHLRRRRDIYKLFIQCIKI